MAAGEYAYDAADFLAARRRRRLPAGRRHALRRDHRTALGRGDRRGHELDSPAHGADDPRPRALRRSRSCAHLEWFHDHVRIERLLFDGFLEPVDGAVRPDLSRPGWRRAQTRRGRAVLVMMPPARPDVDSQPARRRRPGRRDRGRGAFRRRRPRALRVDRLQLPPVPIGVVIPKTSTTSSPRSRSPRLRRADPLARRRHEPCGPVLNVAVVLDFSKYLNRILEIDPERRLARVEPGVVLDQLRDAGRSASADLRARPVHARPLHPRRHDRQQLLRCPLGDGAVLRAGPRTSDNVAEIEVLTYRGERLRAGRSGARRPGRARRSAARPRGPLRRPDPRALSEDPAAGLGLQPRRPPARERLPRRARARRHREHLRHRARGDLT